MVEGEVAGGGDVRRPNWRRRGGDTWRPTTGVACFANTRLSLLRVTLLVIVPQYEASRFSSFNSVAFYLELLDTFLYLKHTRFSFGSCCWPSLSRWRQHTCGEESDWAWGNVR
jgi:hypothetical protein